MSSLGQKRRTFHAEIRKKQISNQQCIIRKKIQYQNAFEYQQQAFQSIKLIIFQGQQDQQQTAKALKYLYNHISQSSINKLYVINMISEMINFSDLLKKLGDFVIPFLHKLFVNSQLDQMQYYQVLKQQKMFQLLAQKICSFQSYQQNNCIEYIQIFNIFGQKKAYLHSQLIRKLKKIAFKFSFIQKRDNLINIIKFVSIISKISYKQGNQQKISNTQYSQGVLRFIEMSLNKNCNQQVKKIVKQKLFYLSISANYSYQDHFQLIKLIMEDLQNQNVLKLLKFINNLAYKYNWLQYNAFQLNQYLIPIIKYIFLSQNKKNTKIDKIQLQNSQIQKKLAQKRDFYEQMCIKTLTNILLNSQYDDKTQMISNLTVQLLLKISFKETLQLQMSYFLSNLTVFLKNTYNNENIMNDLENDQFLDKRTIKIFVRIISNVLRSRVVNNTLKEFEIKQLKNVKKLLEMSIQNCFEYLNNQYYQKRYLNQNKSWNEGNQQSAKQQNPQSLDEKNMLNSSLQVEHDYNHLQLLQDYSYKNYSQQQLLLLYGSNIIIFNNEENNLMDIEDQINF